MSHAGTVAMASAPFVLISSRANSSDSSCQVQASSATVAILLPGMVCCWHTGKKPQNPMAEIGLWQTRHHSTLSIPRGPGAKAGPARTHPGPALPFPVRKERFPPCPHPLLVSPRSMATGWKSKGRKEPEMHRSIVSPLRNDGVLSISNLSSPGHKKITPALRTVPQAKPQGKQLRNTLSPAGSFYLPASPKVLFSPVPSPKKHL